jgi:hypothetical protein
MSKSTILITKDGVPHLLEFGYNHDDMDQEKAEKCVRNYSQGHDGNFTLECFTDGKLVKSFSVTKQ